jgi:hypothetical protein
MRTDPDPILQKKIVEQARTYLGTPFRHHARGREAIDCVGLPLRVAEDLRLVDRHGYCFKADSYSNYRALPRRADVERVLEWLMVRGDCAEGMPGDVAVFRTPLESVLLGILSDVGVIRADWFTAGCVVEHRIDASWSRRICSVFSIPDQY